jgi:iron(III) transport system permease protein
MKHSLILAGSTATLVVCITAVMGWCIARQMRGGRLMDILAAVPLAFPAIVFSFAFLQIYLNALPFVYNSLISLIIVSSVAFMPYGVRYAQLGSMQIHPELEEAASLTGARFVSIFFRIVVPLLAPALISGWLFIFLLSARAMSLVLLLVGPDSAVVAVSLFDLWNNGQLNELAALGILWTMIMTVFSFAFYWVARRFRLPFT